MLTTVRGANTLVRNTTQALSPRFADWLFTACEQGATRKQLQRIAVAHDLGHCSDVGTAPPGGRAASARG
ncbi:hypothetical protein ACIPN8_36810 [Streptomyces sp. NPDC086082]|uniref:hypothetical protein n=1 Tax=Streptomyces sp. NPDC086082 TaxID=3365750 RepID=UPI003813449C